MVESSSVKMKFVGKIINKQNHNHNHCGPSLGEGYFFGARKTVAFIRALEQRDIYKFFIIDVNLSSILKA